MMIACGHFLDQNPSNEDANYYYNNKKKVDIELSAPRLAT
jgi:hypothetical protein